MNKTEISFFFCTQRKKQNLKKLKTSKFIMSFAILLFIHFIENYNKTKRPKGKIMLVVFLKKYIPKMRCSSIFCYCSIWWFFYIVSVTKMNLTKNFLFISTKRKEEKKFVGYLEHNKLTIEDVDEFDEHKQRC